MKDTKELFDYDLSLLNDEIKLIAGIDEVGRGCLAGPVVVACVIMKYDKMIDGVMDSKLISKKNRELLYNQIMENAVAVSISSKSNEVVDQINILNATKEAMKESFSNLVIKPDTLLIDAVKLNICKNEKSIIHGDSTSYAIACASIIAKVHRDRLLTDLAKQYAGYDFENNVGYGTKKHREALKLLGKCPIHRESFLKKIIN